MASHTRATRGLYLQMISAGPPRWQYGGPTRLSHSYFTAAAASFQRSVILTAAGSTMQQAATAAALGCSTTDVLLAHPLGGRLPASVPGPLTCTRLWRAVRTAQVTVVHLLEFKSSLALIAIGLRRLMPGRVRLVHSAFGQLSTLDFELPLNRWLARQYFRQVDRILCQSEAESVRVRELALKFGRSSTLAHTLPLAVLDAPPTPEAALDARVSANTCRRAIFLGRMVAEKGVLETVGLVQRLRSTGGPDNLVVHGPEPDREFGVLLNSALATAQASGLSCRHEQVGDPSRRYDLYAQGDVFVMLPTVKEESSLATIEALTTGCKVLINQNCLIPGLEEFPSLIRVVDENEASAATDGQLVAWLQAPVNREELVRLRRRFIDQGRQDLLAALAT